MTTQKTWVTKSKVYKSRRGDYKLTSLNSNPLEWTPEELGNTPRDLGVISEIEYAIEGRLEEHPYWENEPKAFIDHYTSLYQELFSLTWLDGVSDRHNVVVNRFCCMTLVQYHNGILYAYSRSTDMRNGYYSDKKVLDYLAQHINAYRPDCKVERIYWYLACPHVYVEKGIARLTEDQQ